METSSSSAWLLTVDRAHADALNHALVRVQ